MRQVLFYGLGDGPPLHTISNRYFKLVGDTIFSIAARAHSMISANGAIKGLSVRLSGAPGAGKSYTFTLMVNGAPSALTCEVADTDTTGGDIVHVIDVVAGDYVYIQCDPDGTPTARHPTVTTIFEGETANESLIIGGPGDNSLNKVASEYAQVMGSNTNPTLTENDFRQVIPTAGTIKDLYVKLDGVPGTAPDAYRFTVRLNGATVGESLIVTITANATTGNDLVHNLVVAPYDVVTMMIEPLNTPSLTPRSVWSMTFVADIDGESIILGGSLDDLHATSTEYTPLTSQETKTWNTTEAWRVQLGQYCTLKKLHILLSGSPGAGNRYDFTIRIAGLGSNVEATVSDLATTGDSGVLEDDVAYNDYVSLECRSVSTPTVRDAYWGLVCYVRELEKDVRLMAEIEECEKVVATIR